MRNIYKTLSGLACLLAVFACDDLMDTHKEFVKDGEIIYAPKPDTVYFHAGKNRIQLNYEITKSPNIKEMEVSWNLGECSKTFPLEMVDGANKGTLYIDELEERAYTFEVKLKDSYGHSSLMTSGFGRVYGNTYQSMLRYRNIDRMIATNEGGTVEWMPSAEGLLYNEVKYIDNEGHEQCVQSSRDEMELLLPDFKSGTGISYRSAYLPEEDCADVFYTEWKNSEDDGFVFPHIYTSTEEGIDRSGWKVLYCASNHVGGGDGAGPGAIIDGKNNTYWHSGYDGYDKDQVACPYPIIFDMGESLWLGKIGVMQRNGSYNYRLTAVNFYISDDETFDEAGHGEGNNWTLLCRTNPVASNNMQWFDIAGSVLDAKAKGHLLKMVIAGTQSSNSGGELNNGICAMAEMSVQRISTVDGDPIE